MVVLVNPESPRGARKIVRRRTDFVRVRALLSRSYRASGSRRRYITKTLTQINIIRLVTL